MSIDKKSARWKDCEYDVESNISIIILNNEIKSMYAKFEEIKDYIEDTNIKDGTLIKLNECKKFLISIADGDDSDKLDAISDLEYIKDNMYILNNRLFEMNYSELKNNNDSDFDLSL